MERPAVTVLLATRDSGARLEPLLGSLLAQSLQDFIVLAADDGSTDGTPELLASYAPRFGGRLVLIRNDPPTGSAKANFSRLMGLAQTPYAMFCDHDDIWLPHKIADSLAAIRGLEAAHAPGAPLLVFTDLTVVDDELRVIAPSMWAHQRIDPKSALSFRSGLINASVTGCASIVNRALIDLAAPVPAAAAMHDWWAALVAAAFGKVGFLSAPSALYRQHGGNVAGAQDRSWGRLAAARDKAAHVRRSLDNRLAQAEAFAARYADRLSPEQRRTLDLFLDMKRKGWAGRRLAALKGRFFFNTAPRNLALFLFL